MTVVCTCLQDRRKERERKRREKERGERKREKERGERKREQHHIQSRKEKKVFLKDGACLNSGGNGQTKFELGEIWSKSKDLLLLLEMGSCDSENM